jgi:type I restriction enzyme S subunit
MNETLESIARALFQSWFVDFDPVRAKAEGRDPGLPQPLADLFPDSFEDSELGEIPRGWEVHDVYGLADVVYGAPFKSALFNETGSGKPLIRIRDLATHDPQIFTPEEHSRGYLVAPGDLVVGMDGEFRAHLWRGPEAWLNQRLCCFKPKTGVPRAVVHYSIESLLDFFERSKTGTTVIHLGKSDIDTFRVLVPSAGVLRAFGAAVDPPDARIVATEGQSRTLTALRDTLLPKLISGELRIKDTERIASASA